MGNIPGSGPCEEARSRAAVCMCSEDSFRRKEVGSAWASEVEKEWKQRSDHQLRDTENSETGVGPWPTNGNMGNKWVV